VVVMVVVVPSPHPWLAKSDLIAVVVQETKTHPGREIVAQGLVERVQAGTPAD